MSMLWVMAKTSRWGTLTKLPVTSFKILRKISKFPGFVSISCDKKINATNKK